MTWQPNMGSKARAPPRAMDSERTTPGTAATPSSKRRRVDGSGVGAAQDDDGVGGSAAESDGACGSNACNGTDASCCPVCLESEGELLQRGCCCRGDSGVEHLKCMVQVATHAAGHQGWWCCSTCMQEFTGAVQVGLARAWWATVASNDEGDTERLAAAANLANAHAGQGEYTEAEKLEVAVLTARKRVLGEEHPNTFTSAGNLALTYSNQGNHAEAEALQVAVLAVRKRVLGKEHPSTLMTAGNLALT